MKNGALVRRFERAFAEYVGADYAIAMCNGTATLHTAVAIMTAPGNEVAVPPLTMSSTTLAVLHAGCVPRYVDVDTRTWLMDDGVTPTTAVAVPVSLYGAWYSGGRWALQIDDAAQTLRPHAAGNAFTSYSFQASKILPTGEGGMLVTNDRALAVEARSFASLGYPLTGSSVINAEHIKAADYRRHYRVGWNYRMADAVAKVGLTELLIADDLLERRRENALLYADAVAGHESAVRPQRTDGSHDHWAYAVAFRSREEAARVADAVVTHGGERPYAAWALAYEEPFAAALPEVRAQVGSCPVAENLQPRILQFQTNRDARQNAEALRAALGEAAVASGGA